MSGPRGELYAYDPAGNTTCRPAGTAANDCTTKTNSQTRGWGGTNPAWVNNKGFVGGDIDPTGLTNIGARQYDQTLGRFISVDPIMDLTDPQQWNAYAYGNNSPVTYADPTGLKSCSDDACGAGADYEDLYGEYVSVKSDNDGCGGSCGDDDWQLARIIAPLVAAEIAAQNRAREEAERKQRECQASFWCRNGQKLKNAGTAVMDFAAEHADVMGVIAGVVVGLACTAITGGSGAILCGALGGAVSGLVAGGLKCYGGDQSRCGVGSLAADAIISAGLGAAGGAAGVALGGALSGTLAGGLRGGLAGAAVIRGTVGAARQATPARISQAIGGSPNRNLGTFVRSTRDQWRKDAAAMGGGRVALDTGRMLLQGAVSPDGIGAGVVGAVAPTTRDDVVQLATEGYRFNPITGPIQIVGGMLGGGFR